MNSKDSSQTGKSKRVVFDDVYVIIEVEDNIVIGRFKTENVDLIIAKHLVENRLKITQGQPCILIADIRSVKSSTKQARDFFASEKGCEGIIATALIIDSPLGSMIGNFYINISKPLRPVKIFTNEDKAKKWLVQFKK